MKNTASNAKSGTVVRKDGIVPITVPNDDCELLPDGTWLVAAGGMTYTLPPECVLFVSKKTNTTTFVAVLPGEQPRLGNVTSDSSGKWVICDASRDAGEGGKGATSITYTPADQAVLLQPRKMTKFARPTKAGGSDDEPAKAKAATKTPAVQTSKPAARSAPVAAPATAVRRQTKI